MALRKGGRKHVFPLAQLVDGRPAMGISEVLAAISNPRLAWFWLTRPCPDSTRHTRAAVDPSLPFVRRTSNGRLDPKQTVAANRVRVVKRVATGHLECRGAKESRLCGHVLADLHSRSTGAARSRKFMAAS